MVTEAGDKPVVYCRTLEEMQIECLAMDPGDEKKFVLDFKMSQDEASRFAFETNLKRGVGHVWIEPNPDPFFMPDECYKVNVRCSY